MEAKDTVMNDEHLEEDARKDYKGFRVKDECGYIQDILIWTREAQAEISFKAGIRDAIRVYGPYVKALEEENGSLIGLAYTHGWRSSGVEFGKQCRKRIKELKAKSKPS